ncbi:MAG: hypothetical protein NVS3B20_21320 [Polyangiales bacterium]
MTDLMFRFARWCGVVAAVALCGACVVSANAVEGGAETDNAMSAAGVEGLPPTCILLDNDTPAALRGRFHPNDLIGVLAGTGVQAFGDQINAMADQKRDLADGFQLAEGGIETAVGAVRASGMSGAALARGDVTFALWGAGIRAGIDSFRYRAHDGTIVRVWVLGGTNATARSGVFQNLANYRTDTAYRDAHDFYRALRRFRHQHHELNKTGEVAVVGLSWGAVIARTMFREFAGFANEPTTPDDGDSYGVRFGVAVGTPKLIIGTTFFEPDGLLKTISTAAGKTTSTEFFSVNRPDDPVHEFKPYRDVHGHSYMVTVGGCFRGIYGLQTHQIDCSGKTGPCS